ncbi:MAG: phytanoyl-CoA dioxygenase family protein [Alphaproteobacteria bacterium]|nr:MAG: phytanoyl-CoA dioxygenase family protein [Alphaproteobacteria bacterium]
MPRSPICDDAALRVLNCEQVAAFRRDGFVVLPGFFDTAAMRRITAWVDEVTAWPEQPGRHMVYYEDSLCVPGTRVIQRIEDLTPFHDGFRALYCNSRLSEVVAELLGEPAVLFKDKINFKLPGGDGFKAHQDQQAGWSTYASYFITALVSIDAAREDNGCLELAAGWHARGLLGKEWAPLDAKVSADMDFKPCPTAPGDVVLFDSFVPHRSGSNLSAQPRRVLYVTYNRASEGDHRVRYFADKRRSFPPDIERLPGKTYTFRV